MSSEEGASGGPNEKFISEPITPIEGSGDTVAMATGEPGLPSRFTWRGEEYAVATILRKWKESGPCHHGSGEAYLRKHWYEILTTSGLKMTIYFERQARGGKSKARWWLYTTM